ncbi:MAG: peptidase T [Candidatus Heimdallarchaeaceae archaeon]|jgi:tripeptide aminopeptidase
MVLSKEVQDFIQENAIERFLRYIQVDTTASEETGTHPSTPEQLELGRLLKEELLELGLKNVVHDEYGYVYADLLASQGYENAPSIGFLAHLDTSPAASGKNVKYQIHKNYDGSIITFPNDDKLTITTEDSPELLEMIGLDIITASGDTLLGADDKAGVAEIMAAVTAWKKYPELKHGHIVICFTPDEEIGEGTLKIDMEKMKQLKCGYTLDGGEMGELETECFDAWKAEIEFNGLSVHPGYAKNKMINAIDVAARFLSQIPEFETPEHTEDREGFYHLYDLKGGAEKAKAKLIIRDFEEEKNKLRMEYLQSLKNTFENLYKGLVINLEFTHSYENMLKFLDSYPEIIEKAEKAIIEAGLEVKRTAIRGGTDGARLSAKGLPTPNLFAGGMLFHSRKEYIPTKALQKATEVIMLIADNWIEEK